ncbi:hypothetical protein Hamer_G024632 [Homarus americanus]|uniref:Uncharacterized protein n=1 Tax=Homarus americanus TaxID=6706 RepID=A0A8J5JEX2_HOMAM|nr:hypothetical protein Hamer_G024632 [Homarus americanus]
MCGEVDVWRIKTVLVGLLAVTASADDWKEDLSNKLSIGVRDGGYSRAVLDCEDDHMAFVIALEEDFEGVVYTRGSFHTRRGPCFLDATGGKEFALKCHDRITVNATVAGIKSKISLVDPDPGSKLNSKNEVVATSSSSVVTLTPGRLTPPKEEL